MTVVAATDYYEALRLGPAGQLVVEHLRRAAELPRQQPDEPTPEWVEGIREEIRRRAARRPAVREQRVRSHEATDPPAIEFRPHRRPRYDVQLTHGARKEIEQEIRAEAPRGLETGGLLF
jgi:hypothetical protein